MKPSEMTDYELNKAIAELVYINGETFGNTNCTYDADKVLIFGHSVFNSFNIDYCNNWNDLMPLVVEHKVTFWYDSDYVSWIARCYDAVNTITVMSDDIKAPQRALAECLLLVLQETNNEKT